MAADLGIALIAAGVSLLTAVGTIWSSLRNGRALADKDLRLRELERRTQILAYSEPLARAADDLQARLHNILRRNFLGAFVIDGDDRERAYAVDHTVFVIAQYLCWTEIVRRRMQFIDLGDHRQTLALIELQRAVATIWGADDLPRPIRLFAGEQRAIGECLIDSGENGSECMGYGAFLERFPRGRHALLDVLRDEIAAVAADPGIAADRLRGIQRRLLNLLSLLDPDGLRFPLEKREQA